MKETEDYTPKPDKEGAAVGNLPINRQTMLKWRQRSYINFNPKASKDN